MNNENEKLQKSLDLGVVCYAAENTTQLTALG